MVNSFLRDVARSSDGIWALWVVPKFWERDILCDGGKFSPCVESGKTLEFRGYEDISVLCKFDSYKKALIR